MRLELYRVNDDTDSGREYFRDVVHKALYVIAEGRMHSATIVGEPNCPLRDDIEIVEVTKDGEFVRRLQ